MRLTDQGIRGPPFTETGQRVHHDDAVRGLAVCVGTRTKTVTLIVRKGGHRKRHTLGQYDPPHFTLAIARETARDMLAAERLSKTETPRTTMFFNWCMRRGYIESAPTTRMETPRKPRSRERTLSAAELVAIWRSAPDDDYGRILRLPFFRARGSASGPHCGASTLPATSSPGRAKR